MVRIVNSFGHSETPIGQFMYYTLLLFLLFLEKYIVGTLHNIYTSNLYKHLLFLTCASEKYRMLESVCLEKIVIFKRHLPWIEEKFLNSVPYHHNDYGQFCPQVKALFVILSALCSYLSRYSYPIGMFLTFFYQPSNFHPWLSRASVKAELHNSVQMASRNLSKLVTYLFRIQSYG